jgi:hypothetical protein
MKCSSLNELSWEKVPRSAGSFTDPRHEAIVRGIAGNPQGIDYRKDGVDRGGGFHALTFLLCFPRPKILSV